MLHSVSENYPRLVWGFLPCNKFSALHTPIFFSLLAVANYFGQISILLSMSHFYANWACECLYSFYLNSTLVSLLKIVLVPWTDDYATDYLHRDSELFWRRCCTISSCYHLAVLERHAAVKTHVCVPAIDRKLQKLQMPEWRQLLMKCGKWNLDPK